MSFKADHIRPTTDRIKESLFNRLQGEWEGARVLDLYAGTGNIGLEALSRGAESVTAVEFNSKSIAIIQRNLAELGVTSPEYSLIKADVLKFLETYRGEPFSIIMADPPFTKSLAHETLESLTKSQAVGSETVIVIEASSHERLDENYLNFDCQSRRDYGDKVLSYWRKQK